MSRLISCYLMLPNHISAMNYKSGSSHAYVIAIISVLIMVANGEIFQALQSTDKVLVSPVLNVWLCHSVAFILIPYYCSSKNRLIVQLNTELFWWFIAAIILVCILLMVPNTLWIVATKYEPVGAVNALFQNFVSVRISYWDLYP